MEGVGEGGEALIFVGLQNNPFYDVICLQKYLFYDVIYLQKHLL